MNFERPEVPFEENPQPEETPLHQKIEIPHIDPIIKIFEDFEKKSRGEIDPVNSETVREILTSFFEQAIENTQIYTSEKYGVAMPWTVFDPGELAKMLYARHGGEMSQEIQEENSGEENADTDGDEEAEEVAGKRKREFVFGSFQLPQHGNEFTFMEEALHQVIKDLPAALDKVKNGQEPVSNRIYNVGSPTNELGTINEAFVAAMEGDKAFDQFGKLYAEFVERAVAADENPEDTTVFLKGFSMGAALAGETGKHLLAEGAVTQSREEAQEKHIPFMQVRMDTAPASSDLPKETKRWRIPAGFIVDGAVSFLTSRYVNETARPDKDRKFLSGVNSELHERGIDPNMTPEQTKLKKRALSVIIDNLRNGVPTPENLKVTEVVGAFDPLTYKDSTRRKILKQKRDHEGALGQNIISEGENKRTFGVNMRHTVPFMRENEMRRLHRAAVALESLQDKTQIS